MCSEATGQVRQVWPALKPAEAPYFRPGSEATGIIHSHPAVALAICYEITVPQHVGPATEAEASAYLASVAKKACRV